MENWNNLNTLLTLNSQSFKVKEREAQELVELCQKGDKPNVKRLLKLGASINCFADNFTPLTACIENDKYDLAVYLLNVRASISYKPKETTDDAFWYALKNKKHEFLALFVKNRCILSINEETRQTALTYATIQSDVKAVEILLNHYKINVNELDGSGNTALHHNVMKENPSNEDLEIGKMLMAAGADTNRRNAEGQTPEEAAKDFAARSMLLSGKMERELEEKTEVVITPEGQEEEVVATPKKKLKL